MPTKRELERAADRRAQVLSSMAERVLACAGEVADVESRDPSAHQPPAAPWNPLSDRERRHTETYRAMDEIANRRFAREAEAQAAMLERFRARAAATA